MTTEKNTVSPEEFSKMELTDARNSFNAGMKKGKILCRVWLLGSNGTRDKLIATKKIKVGKTTFDIRGIGRFWINYDFLREEKKFYVYDIDVTNAVGSLSFHAYDKEKVYPNQSELMLKDGQVKTFMGKAGIPVMYLLVAFIVVAIALAGMMYVLSQNTTLMGQNSRLTTTNQALVTENTLLKEQVISLGGIPNAQ